MGDAVSTSLEAVVALLQSLPLTFRCEADEGVKRLAIQASIPSTSSILCLARPLVNP